MQLLVELVDSPMKTVVFEFQQDWHYLEPVQESHRHHSGLPDAGGDAAVVVSDAASETVNVVVDAVFPFERTGAAGAEDKDEESQTVAD